MKISKAQKERIEQAIKEAESKTSGEIVPVILGKSDSYPAAHFRAAIFFSLTTALLYYYSWFDLDDPMILLWCQIPGLLLGYMLAYISRVKRFFSTSGEIKEEVHQRAIEAFFKNNLHTTQFRTGILIMISLLEKRVEILADSGINEKVKKKQWKGTVEVLSARIRKGEIVDGMVQAISECGILLAEHFPIQEGDVNELSDSLVTDSKE